MNDLRYEKNIRALFLIVTHNDISKTIVNQQKRDDENKDYMSSTAI